MATTSPFSDAIPIEELAATTALSRLLRAYARGVDRCDAALLAELFHPRAEVVTGVVDCSGADFPQRMTSFIRENVARNSHTVASEWFRIDGDSAVGEAYVIAASTAGGEQTLVGGRYLHRFIREGGRWWISGMVFVLDYTGVLPVPAGQAEMFQLMQHVGRFGADDPVQGHWAAAAPPRSG